MAKVQKIILTTGAMVVGLPILLIFGLLAYITVGAMISQNSAHKQFDKTFYALMLPSYTVMSKSFNGGELPDVGMSGSYRVSFPATTRANCVQQFIDHAQQHGYKAQNMSGGSDPLASDLFYITGPNAPGLVRVTFLPPGQAQGRDTVCSNLLIEMTP